jgi:tRNA-specific 2-thiouridylase
MTKVVVALSGGVDSSVAAALLVKEGYEVVGATMRLWSEPGCEDENRCCTPQTRALAAQLCRHLGIPFHVLDTVDLFRDVVVQSFLDGYARGDTPNPCINCNRYLKWGHLLEFAESIGAQYISTGHYARILPDEQGKFSLWRGVDESKDQSYFLSLLTQDHLAHTLFPLADLRKTEVRQIAHEMNLPSADLPESQDLCFLGQRDYRDFLAEYAPQTAHPGPIVDRAGKVLGEHQGLAFYTIGQRKGLPSASQALYVLEKDTVQNRLVVGSEGELGRDEMRVAHVNWIAGEPPAKEFAAEVKIRFRALPAAASVSVGSKTASGPAGSAVQVAFHAPLRDITAGQMAVFYQGDRVLGGGIIS